MLGAHGNKMLYPKERSCILISRFPSPKYYHDVTGTTALD